MRSIFNILSSYFKLYFHLQTYLYTSLLLVLLLSCNYYFELEDTYIDTISQTYLRFGSMFLFQAIPYLITTYILIHFKRIPNPFLKRQFWFLILLGFTFLALDRSIVFSKLVNQYITPLNFSFTRKIANFLSGITFIVIPLSIYALVSKEKHSIYGLFGKFNGMKPYAFLLLGSLICVFIGGFFSDIQSYYPVYLQAIPT